MSEEILDIPIKEMIGDFLEKEEQIIWSEQPSSIQYFTFFDVFVVSFLGIFIYSANQSSRGFLWILYVSIFFLLLMILEKINHYWRVRDSFYALSQKRIFFQIKSDGQFKTYFILLKDIQEVEISNKSIFIKTNETKLLSINHENNIEEKKAQLFIECISDLENVATLIEQKIIESKK